MLYHNDKINRLLGIYNPSDSETCYYQINISIAAASSQVIQNTTNPTITTTSTSVIWVVASISILLCILMIGFFGNLLSFSLKD